MCSETRVTQDAHRPNNYGNKLIEFCKTLGLYIMNGRVGKDQYVGALTCKNSSVVDYAIGAASFISMVYDFEILEFDQMYSDVHSGLSLSLKVDIENATKRNVGEQSVDMIEDDMHISVEKYLWHKDKQNSFVNV